MATLHLESVMRGWVRNSRMLCPLKQQCFHFCWKFFGKFCAFQFVEASQLSLNMLPYHRALNICAVELLTLSLKQPYFKLNNLFLLYGHKCLLKERCTYLTLDLKYIDRMQIKILHAT